MRWFPGGPNRTIRSQAPVLVLLAFVLVALALAPALADGNFEIDGNIAVDTGGNIDWENANSENPVVVVEDEESGQNDNSFGQGAKEDTEVPAVVSGSIPPNKSDLKEFGLWQEEGDSPGAPGYLHLFWTRVQDPSGTTNMDFEFNKNKCVLDETGSATIDSDCSGNGVTPIRSAGDLLIVYELSKGGVVPELFKFTWLDGSEGIDCEASNSYPCWGGRTSLGNQGAINDPDSISATLLADGVTTLGPYDPRTFGEATIDLSTVFDSEQCQSFGSAYLKSRSSDSFTSALKDFIAPEPVNLSNCAQVTIRKVTDPAGDSTSFAFSHDLALVDTSSGQIFNLADSESVTFNDVLLSGTPYSVTETVSAGWDLTSIDCSDGNVIPDTVDTASATVTFTVDETSDEVDCTFTNTARGTVIVEKQTLPDGDGTDFGFDGFGSFNPTLSDGETASVSVSPGSYGVTETVSAGFDLTSISCDDANSSGDVGTATATFNVEAGETVKCTFTNTKRGTVIVEKTVDPSSDPKMFGFDGFGSFNPTLGHGDSASVSVAPGQYTVTETVSAGFDLTSISCDDANSSGDAGTATATFNVEAGETVKCTFTNTARGTIIVEKQTDPDGDPASFTFDPSWTGEPNFSLTDGDTKSFSVMPDTYSVAEQLPSAIWDLTDISCDDSDSTGDVATKTATFRVEAGETVKCTFTNTKRGVINIVKTTIGGTDTFSYTVDTQPVGMSHPDFVLDTDPGNVDTETISTALPGYYEVTETVSTGWKLTSASCDDGSPVVGGTAKIDLDAGETVTCTFENTRLFKVIAFACWENDDTVLPLKITYNIDGEMTVTPIDELADLNGISQSALCGLPEIFGGQEYSASWTEDIKLELPADVTLE